MHSGWASPTRVPSRLPQALSAVHLAQLSPEGNSAPICLVSTEFLLALFLEPADRFSKDVLHAQCDRQLANLPTLIANYRNSFFLS